MYANMSTVLVCVHICMHSEITHLGAYSQRKTSKPQNVAHFSSFRKEENQTQFSSFNKRVYSTFQKPSKILFLYPPELWELEINWFFNWQILWQTIYPGIQKPNSFSSLWFNRGRIVNQETSWADLKNAAPASCPLHSLFPTHPYFFDILPFF